MEHGQRRLGPQTTRVNMENKANEINKDSKAFKGLPPTLTCPIFLVLAELRLELSFRIYIRGDWMPKICDANTFYLKTTLVSFYLLKCLQPYSLYTRKQTLRERKF